MLGMPVVIFLPLISFYAYTTLLLKKTTCLYYPKGMLLVHFISPYGQWEKFLKLMFELSELYGTTVIFVSHDRSIEKLFSRSLSLESINKVV